MKRLLWVDACMRAEQSRTLTLCQAFLDSWKGANPDGEVIRRDLTGGDIPSMTAEMAQRRERAVRENDLTAPELRYARELAQADRVVIGAPYWDLAFPAALKIYLEWASVVGVTFRYTESGMPEGLCAGEKLLYITTAGGPVQGQNFGYDYVKALASMLGVRECCCVAAENMDVWGGPGEENLERAKQELIRLAKSW